MSKEARIGKNGHSYLYPKPIRPERMQSQHGNFECFALMLWSLVPPPKNF